MDLHFYKYHGAGNDFILLDGRNTTNLPDSKQIEFLCHRHFGIGADGLMILKNDETYSFRMEYYNSNGTTGMMCGNGGRCIAAFAKKLKIFNDKTTFVASDGTHDAIIKGNGIVATKMIDVHDIEIGEDYYFMDNGTLHYVKFVDNVENMDVFTEGRKIRYNERFKKNGTNVNFITLKGNQLLIRTYERGVENETLACGTGCVASAISTYLKTKRKDLDIKALGGNIKVTFDYENKTFTNVWLEGPAQFVFEGNITI